MQTDQGTVLLYITDEAHPVQHIEIDYDRLISDRPNVLQSVEDMPPYLLKPEVHWLLDAEKHPTYRLIINLMWATGARVSEILALKPTSFVDDGHKFGVVLTAYKPGPGRPSKSSQQRSPKRYIPITDRTLKDRIQSFLHGGKFRTTDRIFPMARQTINRHIQRLVEKEGGAPFTISAHTFRHSFAIHLLLHARTLKSVSQLLGHRSLQSTEIYTSVMPSGEELVMQGIEF